MPKAKTISLTKSDFPDYLEFDFLRQKGLEHIQQLSGGLWTDHNLHDPGITMLEALCYAVADLGYRTNLDLKDLLAQGALTRSDDNFFKASEVLSCNPLTILDFRKLLMDIEGVENAWLEISDKLEVPLPIGLGNEKVVESEGENTADAETKTPKLNGLYQVILQLDRNKVREDEEILEEAHERLHEHRNLCEDFIDISILKREEIGICAKVHINPDANAEKVVAHIFQQIDKFLSPSIRFYTLKELLDKGKSIEEIFTGRPMYTINDLLVKEKKLADIFSEEDFENLKEYLAKGRSLKSLFSGSPIQVVRGMLQRGKKMDEIFLSRPIGSLNEVLDTNEALRDVIGFSAGDTLGKLMEEGQNMEEIFSGFPVNMIRVLEYEKNVIKKVFGEWPIAVLIKLLLLENKETAFQTDILIDLEQGRKKLDELDEIEPGEPFEQVVESKREISKIFSKKTTYKLKRKWSLSNSVGEIFNGWSVETLKMFFNKEKTVEELFANWPIDILKEFLETGQTIEEIFTGRLLASDSHGFIDVDELKKLKRPRAIYVSDLYKIIMGTYDVVSVNDLKVFFETENCENIPTNWDLELPEFSVPSFSAEMSIAGLKLFKSKIPVTTDETEVIGRYKRRYSDVKKVMQEKRNLDLPIRRGEYRKDLEKYKSVQFEFPAVYNIGHNGFMVQADTQRKAQALQLKGYLMFFDQVLANYLAQLGNVRSLFSLNKKNNNRTYFTQGLGNIPGGRQIINYFEKETKRNGNDRKIVGHPYLSRSEEIAYSVENYKTVEDRDLYFNKTIDIFSNNQTLFKYNEKAKKFEIWDRRLNTLLLESTKEYKEENKAREVYETICFLGSQKSSYEKTSDINADLPFSFKLLYKPEGYLYYLDMLRQEEGSRDMNKRKDRFLNHLSSRFAHDFTEYVLLMYSVNNRQVDYEKIVSDKLNFLTNFPEVSHDRSKGFNYLINDETWDSGNVAGLKKRVAGLMGLEKWGRSKLNHFRVKEKENEFKFRQYNDRKELVFESAKIFPSGKKARDAYDHFLQLVQNNSAYENLDFGRQGVFGFKLIDPKTKEDVAYHPVTYRLPRHRNHAKKYLIYWFKENGVALKAAKDKDGWRFELYWEAYDRMPKLLLKGSEHFPQKRIWENIKDENEWRKVKAEEMAKAKEMAIDVAATG